MLAIYLSGCSNYCRERLGVWEMNNHTFTFNKDGRCIWNDGSPYGDTSGTYSLEKTTFKLILGTALYTGAWEKLRKNTLVLHRDPVEDWGWLLPENMILKLGRIALSCHPCSNNTLTETNIQEG